MTAATEEEMWAAVRAADDLSFGGSRTSLLRQVVADTDAAGVPEIGAAARISLVTAFVEAGELPRALEPFDWLLARHDEAPGWFGDWERRSVLWAYRWTTAGATAFPEVSRERIESGLEGMAERYARAGQGQAPVLAARFAVREAFDGAEAAHSDYLRWISAERTELSDCAACEPAIQARHLAALGRHDEAVIVVKPVLAGELTCPDEPHTAIAEVVASLLELGEAERAAAEHVRGARLLRATVPGPAHARHLALCARSGRLDRGLELLEAWLPLTGARPDGELWTAADGARLLRGLEDAGRGSAPVTQRRWVPDDAPAPTVSAEPASVAELRASLEVRARELAAAFDARNGTGTTSAELARRLDPPPLPDLPLDGLGRPRRSRRRASPGPETGVIEAAGATPEETEPRPVAPPPDGADPAEIAAAGEIERLADAFEAATATEREESRAAALAAWKLVRARFADDDAAPPNRQRAAARLDAWLSIDRLMSEDDDTPTALTAAEEARARLDAAGEPAAALLHAQAVQLAVAQSYRGDATDAAGRVASLAAELLRTAGPAEAGLGLSRLVMVRQLAGVPAAEDAELLGEGGPAEAAAIADPVRHGIHLLEGASGLDHHQLRALVRLLRVRAQGEPPETAAETLTRAAAMLPDGVRPLERALAHADLAGALGELDPAAALAAWDAALRDAGTVGDAGLLGSMLAGSAALRHALGDVARAVADLTTAIPLLDGRTQPLLAAQARFDLARALLDAGRAAEAAEAAEAALGEVTELLAADLVTPAGPDELAPGSPETLGRADVHLAGCAAFAAAEAAAALGEDELAHRYAEVCAQWHRRNGNLIAEAEAWQLAARTDGERSVAAIALGRAAELADAGGDWARAATCRRERATAVFEAAGPDAALVVVEDAAAKLDEREGTAAGRHVSRDAEREASRQLTWHQLALIEQRVRLLALAGRFTLALDAVRDLDSGYRELDDAWSARDVMALRGQIRAELGDVDGGVEDLRSAAAEALAAGDHDQTRGLAARLAAALDAAGRPAAAEQAWQDFTT